MISMAGDGDSGDTTEMGSTAGDVTVGIIDSDQCLCNPAGYGEPNTFCIYLKSCSVLMIYEKEAAEAGRSLAEVKLIDFSHVMEGQGVIDHNFLE